MPQLRIANLVVALSIAAGGCSRSDADTRPTGQQPSDGNASPLPADATTPELIEALEHASVEVRREARRAIEKQVGGGVVFRPYDPPEVRALAVDRYRRLQALAEEQGQQYFVDLVPTLLERMASDDPAVSDEAWRDVRELLGVSFPFDPNADSTQRQATIEKYHKVWTGWQENDLLDFKRHPEKLREHKRGWANELRRREAAARQHARGN
ncbi:MAG: hypothetical protein MI757_20185 [Pirellulales bacterium]|nr:hypothetical protein [Pirellulales bacterium]